jgi:hypothetical protein
MDTRQRPQRDEREKRLPPYPLKSGNGALILSGNSGPRMSEAVNAREHRH